jgi:NAD kinase
MLHTKVDLIVTLGGDGTVLWVSKFNSLSRVLPQPLYLLIESDQLED